MHSLYTPADAFSLGDRPWQGDGARAWSRILQKGVGFILCSCARGRKIETILQGVGLFLCSDARGGETEVLDQVWEGFWCSGMTPYTISMMMKKKIIYRIGICCGETSCILDILDMICNILDILDILDIL